MEHLYRIGTVLFTMLILFPVQSFHTEGNAAGTTLQENRIVIDNLEEKHIEPIFFMHSIEACYANIQLSRLAIEKAQNPYLKDIAYTLQHEHKNWLKELTQLAHKNGLNIPAGMNSGDKVFVTYLSKEPKETFDKQWISILIDKHDSFISQYDSYAAKKQLNPSIKHWITANLPHFQSHQDRLLMFEQSLQFEK